MESESGRRRLSRFCSSRNTLPARSRFAGQHKGEKGEGEGAPKVDTLTRTRPGKPPPAPAPVRVDGLNLPPGVGKSRILERDRVSWRAIELPGGFDLPKKAVEHQ